MDQCKNCECRGDLGKCLSTECGHHENWYAKEQQKEIDNLNHVIEVQSQALAEVRHAQNCGAQWYTKGERGLFMQVRMWLDKASEARKQLTPTLTK